MKILKSVAITCSLLLAAGCANDQRNARYAPYPAYSDSAVASGGAATGSYGTSSQSAGGNNQSYSGGSAAGSSMSSGSGAVSDSSMSSGQSSTDNALVTQVRKTLGQDESLAALISGIQIVANSGTITLSGTVKSEDQKQSIESRVRQISGVTSVDNQLQVSSQAAASGSSEGQANSSQMQGSGSSDKLSPTSSTGGSANVTSDNSEGSTNNVQGSQSSSSGALSSSSKEGQPSGQDQSSMNTSNSGQSSNGSSDQLSPTSGRSDQSSQSSAGTSGASASTDSSAPTSGSFAGQSGGINVTIQGSSQSDHTLASQIRQQLQSDTSLTSALSQIQISLNNGVVTLRGSVPSEQQKRQVESTIERVTGVSSVDNQLQVGSGKSQPSTPQQ